MKCCHDAHEPPPNGSRLSCGRPARRRKSSGRQFVRRLGHNTPLPLKRSPPASFKRLLGGTFTDNPSRLQVEAPESADVRADEGMLQRARTFRGLSYLREGARTFETEEGPARIPRGFQVGV